MLGAFGQSLILGETILNLEDGSGTTTVGYVPRVGIGVLRANRSNVMFKVDGIFYALNGDGTVVGETVDPDAVQYQFVTIEKGVSVGEGDSIPEPSAFSMLLFGSFGLAACRRRRVS